MATLILRNQKGLPLTNNEVDGNFIALNTHLAAHEGYITTLTAHIGAGDGAHAVATEAVNGFMSAADKTKLNTLVSNDAVYANENVLGKVYLATVVETITGVDATKATTSVGVNAAIDAKISAYNATNTTLLDTKIPLSQKGVAGGVATLGDDAKVPASQLPSLDYVPLSQKGVANGVATLGTDSKVPASQLPSLDYVPLSQKGIAGGVATINSSGNVIQNANTATSASKVTTASWEITEISGSLYFKFNGVVKAKLDSSGTFVVSGDLGAQNGTGTIA